jgi:glycosyltransferase involved in cell wall biosynthesis
MEKICFVLTNYIKIFRGGAELQAYFLANELSKKYQVHYLFVRSPKINKINLKKRDSGINLYPMKNYSYKMFGNFLFMNYLELNRLLDKINPDLIYQRGGKPYIGMAARWCNKHKKKLVLGISMDVNCSKNGILNLNKNVFNYPANILNGYFTFLGIKNADLIIAQNNNQKVLLQKNFNRDSIILPNVHNIPSPPFKKSDPLIISWIANIKPLKRPELFIKLAESFQDSNIKFVYAGRPSFDNYYSTLLEKTKKLSNLEFLGEIPFEKTNELLSKSSIFINTSITEGFPNTYIQAWMRETPVVTLTCDPDDLIKNYKLGFHSKNFNQLKKDIRYLIENENIRKNIGKRSRDFAINKYDINKIVNNYYNIFSDLIRND